MDIHHPLFGRRILHIQSPVSWHFDRFNCERCSNWKVMMDTVNYLPMCHHYITVPENNTLRDDDEIFHRENITIIPFPYSQTVMQNRYRFDAETLTRILAGRRNVEFQKGYFTRLEMSAIDIDFVFCHQPEILPNVLWALLSQNISLNNTDAFTFFHWVDCKESRVTGNYPPTFFRQFESIDRCSSVFFHSEMSEKYLMSNFIKDSHVLIPDENELMYKVRRMPLTAKKLPFDELSGGNFWETPKDTKVIAFNHRWNETTGQNQIPEYMEGLPKEYQVFITDSSIHKPKSGKSPISDDGRFHYAYEKIKSQNQFFRMSAKQQRELRGQDEMLDIMPIGDENHFYVYSDFLKKSYAAVAFITGYGTWNLSVQDAINAGTPTLIYDTPMMREVVGNEYPFFFKSKSQFQNLITKLPNDFPYSLPSHEDTFRDNLQTAMKVSWNVIKQNKGGKFTSPWLYFALNGLKYKKDFLFQTHPGMVDGKGSNSWESIRRWCLQFGLKDNPNSRHTELFFPDDETRNRAEEHLKNDSKFDGSKYTLEKHEEFHFMLNRSKGATSLKEFFT